MPKYNHKITLKELKNSESAFIKTALSHEQKNYSEGLQKAEADIGRIGLVNNKNFSEELTDNKNKSNEVQSCNLSNIGKVKIIMKIIYSFIKKCNLLAEEIVVTR